MAKRDRDVMRVAALRRWRPVDARVMVEAWEQSGEGLGAFARRYGVHPRRLGRWVSEGAEASEPVRFHPVRVVPGREAEGGGDASLEIVLGEGCRVRVPPGFAAEDLVRVLEVLGTSC